MFFEDTFGNIFGIIWLIIFIGGVVTLALWLIFREEKENCNEVKEEIVNDSCKEKTENKEVEKEEKETTEENKVEEKVVVEEKKVVEEVKYRIDSGEDGFFRVKKVGDNRTIRKFSTKLEAINYVNEKRNK